MDRRRTTWLAVVLALATACALAAGRGAWVDAGGSPTGGVFTDGALSDGDLSAGAVQAYWIGAPGARCLEAGDPRPTWGTPVQLAPCARAAGQRFSLETVEGHAVVAHAPSGLCLRVEGGSTSAGAALVLDACTEDEDEQFALVASGGRVWLQARHSGLFLEVASRRTAGGADLVQGAASGQGARDFLVRAWDERGEPPEDDAVERAGEVAVDDAAAAPPAEVGAMARL